jgi:hypothetical protein
MPSELKLLKNDILSLPSVNRSVSEDKSYNWSAHDSRLLKTVKVSNIRRYKT